MKPHRPVGPAKAAVLAFLFFASFALDFSVKRWAQAHLAGGPPIPVIPGLFELRYAENTAVAFSLLYSLPGGLRQTVIYTFNAVAITGLISLLYRWRQKGLAVLFPLVLILGGALGNLYDRLVYGHVIDLFHLHYREQWSFPIFNPADVLICCGVGFFLLFSWGEYRKEVRDDDES
ncbi:MAG: signal peptidase II [Firmicutes bacterium]|nr:signal peptidase II [Bacillota bacterium]